MPVATHTTRLSVELERGVNPVAGTVIAAGRRTEFVGWIQLAALFEAQRVDHPPSGENGDGGKAGP